MGLADYKTQNDKFRKGKACKLSVSQSICSDQPQITTATLTSSWLTTFVKVNRDIHWAEVSLNWPNLSLRYNGRNLWLLFTGIHLVFLWCLGYQCLIICVKSDNSGGILGAQLKTGTGGMLVKLKCHLIIAGENVWVWRLDASIERWLCHRPWQSDLKAYTNKRKWVNY